MNDAAPAKPGRRFGRYELLEELGRGGMGVVYRARDTETDAPVAVKVVLAAGALTARDTERLRREALLASRVKHPGIVTVLDAGTVDGVPYFAMSLARGVPLAQLESGVSLEAYARIIAKVARAAGAAHRARVVHRDLKPSNILVDAATHEPVVLDFGLAFDADFELTRLTRTGEVVGTPAYMAPETVMARARPEDPRLDVYALGLMLYTRVLGEHPLVGANAIETVQRIVKGVPPVPRGADRELGAIAARACALDPRDRPPDGDALAAEIEAWLEKRRGAGPPARHGARPLAPLLGGAALLVGGGVLAWAAFAPRAARGPSMPPAPPAPVVARPPAPPPPVRLMSEEEALALDADVERSLESGATSDPDVLAARSAAQASVIARASELAGRSPEDPRVRAAIALARTRDENAEHDVRRELIRAARSVAPAPPWVLEVAARSSQQLGFERAAVELAERAAAAGGVRAAERAFFLLQLSLRAAPPVRDAKRAETIARRLIAAKTPADAERTPDTGTLHLHLGHALLAQEDREGAADELAVASSFAHQAPARASLLEVSRMIREGEIPAAEASRAVPLLKMASTAFLRTIVGTLEACERDRRRLSAGASELEQLAAVEDGAGRSEHAALAWLDAAALRAEQGRKDLRHAALERAFAARLDAYPDTRALVARAFAASLLDDGDFARAEQVALRAVEALPEGTFDARTPGELADGRALVARARAHR